MEKVCHDVEWSLRDEASEEFVHKKVSRYARKTAVEEEFIQKNGKIASSRRSETSVAPTEPRASDLHSDPEGQESCSSFHRMSRYWYLEVRF